MTQHQFYGLQGEYPINHNEELNHLLKANQTAEYEQEEHYVDNQRFQQNFTQGFQNQLTMTNAFQPRQQSFIPLSEPFKPTNSGGSLDKIEAMIQKSLHKREKFDQKWDARLGLSAPPQPTVPAELISKLEGLVEQVLLRQDKTEQRTETMYATLNGKFNTLSAQVQKLDLQVTQNAERAKQQQEAPQHQVEMDVCKEIIQDVALRSGKTLEPTDHSTRLVIQPTAEVDHELRIEQEGETTSTEALERQQGQTRPDPSKQYQLVYNQHEGNELLSTHLTEKPCTLLKTLQKKDDPGLFIVPCSINGVKFEGSMWCISAFQRGITLSPPRRLPPQRIPRSPKVHPPDTGARIMMVARIHHQQLLYAKYSGVDGEDPWPISQANRL